MADIKVESAKRYLKGIKANKTKYLTCDILSKDIGIYPDVIATDLSAFDPIISMDPSYDVRNVLEKLEAFVEEHAERKVIKKAYGTLAKTKYKTVGDFVFDKFVVAGGLMDRSIQLSEADLKELKKIVANELKIYKKKNIESLFED